MIRLFVVLLAAIAVLIPGLTAGTATRTFPAVTYNHPPGRPIWSGNHSVTAFSMRFDASLKVAGYGNFFQTASGKDGLRLEIQPGNHLILFEGDYPQGQTTLDWKGGGWHRFDIAGTPSGPVDVRIDGRQVIRSGDGGRAIPIGFTKVVAGCGFGLTRCVGGTIRDFVFSETSPSYPWIFNAYGFAAAALAFGLIYSALFVWTRGRRPILWTTWGGPANPGVAALLLTVLAWLIEPGMMPSIMGLTLPVASFAAFLVAAVLLARVDRLPRRQWGWPLLAGVVLIAVVVAAGHWPAGGSGVSGPASVARWLWAVGVPLLVAMWVPLLFPEDASDRRAVLAIPVAALGVTAVSAGAMAALLAGPADPLYLALALTLIAPLPG